MPNATCTTSALDPTSIFDPRLREATLAILLIVALSAFEGLAVAAALPQVAASLGSVGLLPWVVTAYLLTSGVATVAAGAWVDRLGVAPVYRVSVLVFIVGGVLAGLAPSMELLIAARALQGAGAGAVNAVGLSAVGLIFPRKLVGRAFAANSTVWGAMSVAGTAIAAVLLGFASWRWIFLLNLPLGGIALAMGWRAFPPPEKDRQDIGAPPRGSDLALLTAVSLFMLLAVGAFDWTSLPLALAALACGLWLLRRNRGRSDALLAPRHIVDSPLGPLAWTVALLLIGGIGVQSFVPLLISGGMGGSTAMTAGSVLFFVLGWTSGANIASRLMDRMSAFTVTQGGASIVPFALFGAGAIIWVRGPLLAVFVLLFIAGAGIGSVTNSALTLLRDVVSDHELGRATAAHQFVRNMGFAVGNALFGALLLIVVGRMTGDVERIREVLGEGGVPLTAGSNVADAIVVGFATATMVSASVALLAQVPLRILRRTLKRADAL